MSSKLLLLFFLFFNKYAYSYEMIFLVSNDNNKQKIEKIFLNKNIIDIAMEGDTNSSISKLYSTDNNKLERINKLKSQKSIYMRQSLIVSEDLKGESFKEKEDQVIHHVVSKGETLTDISIQYEISIQKLININRIEDPNSIKVGTKLLLKDQSEVNSEKNTIEITSQKELISSLKNKRYGPIIIKSNKVKEIKSQKFLNAINNEGKKIRLSINCKNRKINVKPFGKAWKGWMKATEKFENKLLNDIC